MKNSRPMLVALSLVSVVGISLGMITFMNRAILEHVYVFNCGIVDYKPQSMTRYCADANAGLSDIDWQNWRAKGADGTGRYVLNLCTPSCAEGKWVFDDVNIRLSDPVKAEGKTILSRVDISTVDRKNLPQMHSPSTGWDLERKPLISAQ